MTGSLKILCFLSIFVVSITAFGIDKSEEAATHFKKGVALFKDNKKEEAVVEFKTAYQLKPSWKIMYNIGQCEASLRRYGMAIEAFETYLGEGGDEVTVERRDEVLKELDRLRKMVGSIRIQGPEGYDIMIDGIKRGETPMSSSIMVTAGVSHQISLKLGTKVILDVSEKISGGETLELAAKLPKTEPEPEPAPLPAETPPAAKNETSEPKPAAKPFSEQPEAAPKAASETETTHPKPATTHTKPLKPILFFASASAAVLFGGATVGLALAIDKKWKSSEDKIYNDPWAVNANAVEDNIRTLQLLSWGTLGLAGVAVILAAISAPFTQWRSATNSDTAAVSLTPLCGQHHGGLSIQGRF